MEKKTENGDLEKHAFLHHNPTPGTIHILRKHIFRIFGPPSLRKHVLEKFIYSEKAEIFFKISTVDLSYEVAVKSTVEISQNFVAFSKYMYSTENKQKLSFFLTHPLCLQVLT